jgi:hypothetical protein
MNDRHERPRQRSFPKWSYVRSRCMTSTLISIFNILLSTRRHGSAQYLPVWFLITDEIRNAQTRCFAGQALLRHTLKLTLSS